MSKSILLYGATGFSGRLIAEELARWRASIRTDTPHIILAGRDGNSVLQLASHHDMDARVFGLDEVAQVRQGLWGVDVVINAAGPFALTAERMAKSALAVGCHYVDICGEADVIRRLDDLGSVAHMRKLALVSGAGHSAAVSNLMLEQALAMLGNVALGAVRIGLSRVDDLSRGSARVLWRSVREQIAVARVASGGTRPGMVLSHEPVGRLQHFFDFPADTRQGVTVRRRSASAANVVDTLAARTTLNRRELSAESVVSYVEADSMRRLAYDGVAIAAPIFAVPQLRELANLAIDTLGDGPGAVERQAQAHAVVLEIEDAARRLVVHRAVRTPNVYDSTARFAVACAGVLAQRGTEFAGWQAPGCVLLQAEHVAEHKLWRGYSSYEVHR